MTNLKQRMNQLRGLSSIQTQDDIITAENELSNQHMNAREQEVDVAESNNEMPFAKEWTDLQVKLIQHDEGEFLLRTLRYSFHHFHGMHKLGEWPQVAFNLTSFSPNLSIDAESVLFLDLETTGLGAGTGNVPFMIGFAYCLQNEVIVEQAVIRHPAEERAMLAYFAHFVQRFTHLVTYNGKTFDWPLLKSRYVLNGWRGEIWEPVHIDLLHPSRSIWRNTLESCKLSHVEEMRLGIMRENDLPGSEAPALYFQFLSEGKPNILREVYKHNELDMLTLISLATRFGHLLSDGEIQAHVQQPTDPEEMVRTGLWLEKMRHSLYSEKLYQLAWHIPASASETLLLLAERDKKYGNVERSILCWKRIVEQSEDRFTKASLTAGIELAKYYEHKIKDLRLAYHYAVYAYESYKNIIKLDKLTAKENKNLAELEKRMKRVQLKMIR